LEADSLTLFVLLFFFVSDCRKKYEQNEAKRQAQFAQARKQAAFAKSAAP